jgi:serine/threonine-protein kinase
VSTNSEAGSAALPLSLERQVNAACNRFESAWRAGGRPRLEDYLADCPEPARQALLAELLTLELAYRVRDGEAPAAEEYRARFPSHDALIDEAFRTLGPLTGRPPPISEESTAPEPAPRCEEAEPPAVLGYELQGLLGRGGMGDVWGGRDRLLQRDVAVKVMKVELAGCPRLARRFLEEAQVASQLAHPAIPPVHEFGELPDGRPYFVMKLVRGRTLADILKQRSGTADELPRFLGIFEQVCQAVAYAHSKGVLHRDLKPRNVMVGAFGEVQVMDWGLAKVLAAPPPEAAADATGSPVATVRTGAADDATQEGWALGTLAYMAPEQARGEVAWLDQRCDVFGLGAMLCEVLTGLPPYVGTGEELRAQAQVGHLAPARERLSACGADPELVGLAGRCMGARVEERPADAGEVAAAVTAHLAGVQERLRKAELERTAAQARAAEERKRRRVQLALVAAVLALVIVGGGATVWWGLERTAVVRDTEAALTEAAGHQAAGRWPEARAALERAAGRLGGAGPADLRHRLDVAQAELVLVNRLDGIRQRRAMWVGGHFDNRTAARDYAAAFRENGLGEVGEDEAAVAARIRASAVSAQLVAALDDWAYAAEKPAVSWLLAVARRADPDPSWRDRFRDPAVWWDRQTLQALADEALRIDGAKLGELSPQLLTELGLLLGHHGADSVPLLRAAQRRYPNDFWLSLGLGSALYNAKQVTQAVGYLQVAVALRPDSGTAHNNLGLALHASKDLEGAIAEYRKAIDCDPKNGYAYNNLGNALKANGDPDRAIAAYRKAIELEPNLASPHYNLGLALRARGNTGDPDEAIEEFGKSFELDRKFAPAHYDLGLALIDKGKTDGAIEEFRRAIEIDGGYAKAHGALGLAMLRQGRFVEARAALRRCLDLLPDRDPWRQAASQYLQESELGVAAEEKLAAVLSGEAEPDGAAECLALAQVCRYRRLHAAAARFYADAFADPKPAADLIAQHRYNAACSAALAAAGQAEDAKHLPDRAAVKLRREALGWLCGDLALYAKLAERGAAKQFVRQKLTRWREDSDLASVRDPEALVKLPDDERAAWRQLWQDVAALLKKVEEKT